MTHLLCLLHLHRWQRGGYGIDFCSWCPAVRSAHRGRAR